MNSACAWMEAALAVKGPASWKTEGSASSCISDRGSQRSAGSGVWSAGTAKEAWAAYVHKNLAPVLASAFAINSGTELPGEGDAAALLNLTLEQAQLFQHSADGAQQTDNSRRQAKTASEAGFLAPEPAENGKEVAAEERSSATYDEALWAALAAAATRSTKGTARAAVKVQEASNGGCQVTNPDGAALRQGSPSLSGGSSDADVVDSWTSFPSRQAPLSEPSSFNGTFRAQRARRMIRVIRSAAKPRAPAPGNGTAAAADRASPQACCSAPEAAACAGSPRRTRKKRAATSLMEGGVAFHTPSSAGPGGKDAGGGASGRQRTPGGSTNCPTGQRAASSSRAASVASPAVLQTPPFVSASLVSPLRSHQIQTPSTGSSSTACQREGSPQAGETPSLRNTTLHRDELGLSGDAPSASSCLGRPPLLLAAATGRADIIRHLLASAPKEPPNPRSSDYGLIQQELEQAALLAAALASERAPGSRLPGPFVAAPAGLAQPDCQTLLQCTALHLAALFGHVQVAQVLLESPACSVSSRNAQGTTALHIAAREGWAQFVSLLALVPECNLDACDYGGRTAMHLAAAMGRADVVNKLWCSGCKIEPVDSNGWSALHYAAEAGSTGVVANLVIAGCHVHTGTSAGWTAAHLAAYSGHTEVLQKLLLGGYDVDCASGSGACTALQLAAQHGHLQAVNVLLMAGANVQLKCDTGADVLQCAAESGCHEVFERILEVGKSDLAGRDLAGAHLVHSAAKGGNGAILQTLLDRGGDETAITSVGRTCLHYAAHGGHMDMTEWLLKRGASVNREDCVGVTPLMLACEAGSPEMVSLLLAHGADLHASSAAGCTPLHFASSSGSERAVDLLLEKGADVGVVCQRGTTALHHAAESNRSEVLERLLQSAREALIRVKDALGWTALHYAASHEQPVCSALLIEAGAELDAQNTADLTPLHVAARARSVAVVRLLLECSCDGSLADASGRAALHYAAQSGEWPLFSTLYEHPACAVMDADDRGLTPLHYAVEGGSLEIVGVLLAHMAALKRESPGPAAPRAAGDLKGQQDDSQQPSGSKSQQRTPHVEGGAQLRSSEAECRSGAPHVSALSPKAPDAAPGRMPSCSNAAHPSNAIKTASFTPIHMAAYKGHAELIPCLLQAGYSVSTLDSLRRTPLHYAALQGCHAFELPSGTTHEAAVAAVPPLAMAGAAAPGGLHGWLDSCAGDSDSKASPAKQTSAADAPPCSQLSRSTSSTSGSSCGTAQSDSTHEPQPSSGVTIAAADAPAQWPAQAGPGAWPAAMQWPGLMPRVRIDFAGASELLLAARVDVYAVDACGRTALHYAAGTGEHALVEQLLDLGVAMGAADAAGWTPLAWAAAGGHATCVSLLLEAGAGVGSLDDQGRLPLHWAAERGRAHVVALLVPAMLQAGSDLHALDKTGLSAVALAAAGGHVECVAQILDSTTTATERGLSALHLAVQDGLDLLVAQLLLLPGAAPDSRDKDGLTPLHWAASRGSDMIVGQLLAAVADIDAVTNDSWTALHEASLNGHTAVVERLLQAGAQVCLKTSMGLTALHNAASNGHTEVVELLLAAGAAPNARALSNATALFCAAGAGHTAIVRRLLAVGAEVGVAAGAGATALHAAAGAGHLPVVEALLDGHADVDVQAQNGATALHNATGGGYNDVVKALLGAKADTDVQNGNCNTALHLASGKGHVEVVETLLAAGASAHIRNAKGWAPVHSAAAAGQLEAVLRLVAAGAAPRSRPDLDVLRLLTRKTTYRHSYVEGRLRLAEKERQRIKSKTVASGAQTGPSQEELASLEAQANANMAALLEEEEVKKDVVEKKKNKKKDKKKRKGKKGSEKEAEEEAGSADDAKQDGADAVPSIAEHEETAEHQEAVEEDAVGRPEVADPPCPPAEGADLSEAPPVKLKKQADSVAAKTPEARVSNGPAAKANPRTPRSKSPAKAVKSRKQPAEVTMPGKAAQAAEEDASEWQSVGTAQRKARRALKLQDPQPGSAPRPAPASGYQQQPPPPPRAAAGSNSASAKPAARAVVPGKGSTAPSPQEARPVRSQPRAADVRAAADAAAPARGNAGAPSFADVARPGHPRAVREQPQPAAASVPDAEASSALQGKPSPGKVPGPVQLLPHITAPPAAAEGTPGISAERADTGRAAADEGAPLQFGSQPPVLAAQPRHQLPPQATAATLAPIASSRPPPQAAAPPKILAPSPPSTAPSSGLSALAKIWRPTASELSTPEHLIGPLTSRPLLADELGVGNAEADSAPPKPQVLYEGSGSAVPISAAPAVWRSGLHARSVDWSFPRNGSGTSLSSLAPPPQANGGLFLDNGSDRVTCSSLESSASLCLAEGTPAADLGDGASAKNMSRLQYSSSPLNHMSMGSGGIHAAAAGVRASPEPPKDYAAVLNDIWNSPQREQPPGAGPAAPAATPPPKAGVSGNNSEVRRMAEAYQLTCPITRELMRDPVVASDGYTYERSAIEAWMATTGVSPRTGQPLKHKDLVPNLTLRASISILIPRSCLSTHF